MDNTERFTGLAGAYDAGRPTYAKALVDYLYKKGGLTPTETIADIGCGTGKWSAQFLAQGNRIYGVEPNDDMRQKATSLCAAYTNFHVVKGTADATTLGDNAIDWVMAAQAFHWFDPVAFRRECQRILRPTGKAALIWNIRDQSAPVHQDSYAIYQAYCPTFKGFHNGLMHDDSRIQTFFGGSYDYVSFANPLYYTVDTFLQRHLSNSYSLRPGDAHYDEFIKALRHLFTKHAIDDTVTMPCQTVAYIGSII